MSISRIVNNISAINANRNLGKTGQALQKSIERLSTGLRINRSSDDVAGLSVANRLRTQVQGLNQAVTNASDDINLINVAEGALEQTTLRLNRIRQLAVQAANTAVNDISARQAAQDEIFQSIDEITRIANTTQFGENYLLNGDFSVKTRAIEGQQNIGLAIDVSPVASTLDNGRSYLNIVKIQDSQSQILGGDAIGQQQVLNTGIRNQKDIAVSLARFSQTDLYGTGLTATSELDGPNNYFNGVSIQNGDMFIFDGVLADGVTRFHGSFSIATTYTLGQATDTSDANAATHLIGAINRAIQDAETALFGVTAAASVPSSFHTTVSIGSGANSGRLLMFSEGNYINQSSINVTMTRGQKVATQAFGVTRSGEIGAASKLSGVGQVGNSITAITGSTFGSGIFTIDVRDVQAAQQRKLENKIVFHDQNGGVLSKTTSLSTGGGIHSMVLNGTFVNNVYTGGVSMQSGDTLTLRGTNADGTSFEGTFTYYRDAANQRTYDTTMNDFRFSSLSGLIKELNYRTRIYSGATTGNGVQTRFEDALFTLTSEGSLQLIDDVGRSNSQLSFTLTFQNGANHLDTKKNNQVTNFTFQDDAVLAQEGFYEEATLRINDGEAVRARAGDLVTLYGPQQTMVGSPQQQITFRLGNGFSTGIDKLDSSPNLYVGSLNGGQAVTFQNGQQNVQFLDGNSGGNRGVARFLTVDFNSIIDVTSQGQGLNNSGRTVILSTVNSSLNFHVGANAYQSFSAAIGDLTAENLGYGKGSKRTVADINVTTLTGANEAIKIIDAALEQVNKTRSILGASSSRLDATVSSLSVSGENIQASESRIRDVDIATETSEYTKNQVLQQAGISVLAQANLQPQNFLALISR